jgi:ABC-type uncharacterized transport system substrate-binding protein
MKTIHSLQNQKLNTASRLSIKRTVIITFLLTLISMSLISCTSPATSEPAVETDATTTYDGKKIVFIDSYHTGYEWSDGLESGLKNTLADTGVELSVIHMDTKRNTDEAFGEEAAIKAKAEIEAFAPDAVIACDDNAQVYLVVPYLKDTDLPVVFCGVNWDATIYGYPTSNITGMVEVDSIKQLVDLLENYTEGRDIAYLTEDTTTERKVYETHNERFFNRQLQGVFVTDFQEFKSEYLKLQDEVDMIYIGNNASLTDWNEAEAKAFVLENTKIPSGSIYDWMAPYALLVVGKLPEEQTIWAAETTLSILDGTPISDIPVTENKESSLILNLNLAEKLDVVFTPSMLRYGELYGE